MAGKSLARIAALYDTVERLRLSERQVAANRVVAIKHAIDTQSEILHFSRGIVRSALLCADGLEASFAENQFAVASMRITQLSAALTKSYLQLNSAIESHRISSIEREQMSQLLETDTSRAEIEEARLERVLADERFLSRLMWQKAHAKRRLACAQSV